MSVLEISSDLFAIASINDVFSLAKAVSTYSGEFLFSLRHVYHGLGELLAVITLILCTLCPVKPLQTRNEIVLIQ